MALFGFGLGSEAGEKSSQLSTWKEITRDSPAWGRTKCDQAISKAKPKFCRRDEKWVMILNLQNSFWMFPAML